MYLLGEHHDYSSTYSQELWKTAFYKGVSEKTPGFNQGMNHVSNGPHWIFLTGLVLWIYPKFYGHLNNRKSSRYSHVENMEASSFLGIHRINLWINFILLHVIIELQQNKKTEQELRLFYHEFYRNISNEAKFTYFFREIDQKWT